MSGLADDIAGGDADGIEADEEGDGEEDGLEGAKKNKKRVSTDSHIHDYPANASPYRHKEINLPWQSRSMHSR